MAQLASEFESVGVAPFDGIESPFESLLVEEGSLGKDDGGRLLIDACSQFPCLLYTSPSPRDLSTSRMPSSA